ncbi:MAG: DUF6176 family protein [Patescibacteria group bacterium]
MRVKIFKIKEGKEEQWLSWCKFLVDHNDEVIQTLKEEENIREINYLFEHNREKFIVYFQEGKFKPASDCELNKKHFKNLEECLEKVSLEKLFDFKV